MKIAYVAGFFTPVEAELRRVFETQFNTSCLVWIPQKSNGQLDLNRFKSDVFRQAKEGARCFLLCAFVFRDHEFLLHAIQAIILSLNEQYPDATVEISKFKNARDINGLKEVLGGFNPRRELIYPHNLDEIEAWCEQHHNKKLLLHPRAIRGAKKSSYLQVETVFRALRLLAEEYRDLRLASTESRPRCSGALVNKLDELGIELSPSMSPSRAGEQGDEYKITYPVNDGEKVDLDLHLKKGSDRDTRNCLRIYFFWDDREKLVVIGWMTSHLDTRST